MHRKGQWLKMSVWFAIPSARPAAEIKPVVEAWHDMGYKVAFFRNAVDFGCSELRDVGLDYPFFDEYPGYARAANKISSLVLYLDPACSWIVTGGDDTYPDPKVRANVIAEECNEHFSGHPLPHNLVVPSSTFGVMQPTGDRFAGGSIDRIAGSAWVGREWCHRANKGQGPFWPEFTHMFVDQCLKETAEKLGVYWMRRDLVHMHRHFQRESDALDSNAVARTPPPHLTQWNTATHWEEMKAIYERLKAGDFASCMPL